MQNRTTIHWGPMARTDLVLADKDLVPVGKDLVLADKDQVDMGRDLVVDRAQPGKGLGLCRKRDCLKIG